MMNDPPLADDSLADVRAARSGDAAAYARIVDRFQIPIAQRMSRFARNRAAVDELTHDVFVEAYLSLHTFRADAPFAHWLQRIATRVGFRYWKKQQRERRIERLDVPAVGEDLPAKPAVNSDAADAAELLNRVLEKLPPRDRLVVTLLHVEERSVEETAQLTGWSRTMVKVQAFRARGKLKRLLADAGLMESGNEHE